MNNQDSPRPLPLTVLLVGFFFMAALALWTGSRFFLHGDSPAYGIIGGISLGAAYAFGKQIHLHYMNKGRPGK